MSANIGLTVSNSEKNEQPSTTPIMRAAECMDAFEKHEATPSNNLENEK